MFAIKQTSGERLYIVLKCCTIFCLRIANSWSHVAGKKWRTGLTSSGLRVAYHGETLFQSRRLIATLKSIVPWPVCDLGVLAYKFSAMPDKRWDSTALSSLPLNRIARVSLVPNLRRQLSSRWRRKLCFQQETV